MQPELKVLAFDTSAAHCAAALLCGDKIFTRVDDMARGQAEHLMPMLEEMLAMHRLTWRDLDALGIGIGPGNFTGVRISVSAARGLALGLGVPAIGVTGFEARAYDQPRPYLARIPAPRRKSYVQTFHADGTKSAAAQSDTPADTDRPVAEQITAIARIAAERWEKPQLPPAPFYIRPADAAPPREAPPVILP